MWQKYVQKNRKKNWENLDRGQYRFQTIKFVNFVVPSPYETEPYNKRRYQDENGKEMYQNVKRTCRACRAIRRFPEIGWDVNGTHVLVRSTGKFP